MRKTISTILAIALVLSLMVGIFTFPTTAEAASGTCGENLTWSLTEDGTLTISGAGEMEDYRVAADGLAQWNSIRTQIKEIIISEGVTSIGTHAFTHCSELVSVSLPETLKSIGEYAFYNCAKLEGSIAIPNGQTIIGAYTFYYCERISKIIIPNSVVEIKQGAFEGCKGLSEMVLPDDVAVLGTGVFANCTNLKTVLIPDTVAEIGEGLLAQCVSLKELTIPSGFSLKSRSHPTDSYTEKNHIAPLFGYLQEVNRVGFYKKTMQATYPHSPVVYYIPYKLTTIHITGNGNFSISYLSSITTVTLGEGISKIGKGAFSGCTALTEIVIPRSVTEIDNKAGFPENDFVIYGYRNSYAETYAQENGYTFIPLSDPGDMDGDGVLSDEDAVYLLYHIYFPDDYPTSQNCDFDGDGEVTDADATYLLYHIYFPEDYPLH